MMRRYAHLLTLLVALVVGVAGCDRDGAAPEEQESGGSPSEPVVVDPGPPPP